MVKGALVRLLVTARLSAPVDLAGWGNRSGYGVYRAMSGLGYYPSVVFLSVRP